MKKLCSALALVLLSQCTPGGVNPGAGGASASNIVTIDVSLAAFGAQQTPAGIALGFSPIITTVPVGTGIQFRNVDNTVHTASMVAGPTFPHTSPLGFSATSPSSVNTISSQGWSAGNIQAGETSLTFLVDKPGTYLFGCFYHYSGNMRGEIIGQ